MIKKLFIAASLMVSLNAMAAETAEVAKEQAKPVYQFSSTNKNLYNDCYREKADNPMEAMMDGMEDMMDSFDTDKCNGSDDDDGFFGRFF